MGSITLRKKISFLGVALGSLMATGLNTGKAEAAPLFSCTLQCNVSSVTKSAEGTATLLNKCAENCDNRKIMDSLLANDNYKKLNPTNLENFQNAVMNFQAEKNILIKTKQQEFDTIDTQLKGESATSKPSKTTQKSLQKKLDKLNSDIKGLTDEIGKFDTLINEFTKGQKAPMTIKAPEPISGMSKAGQAFFKRNFPNLKEGEVCLTALSKGFHLSATDEAVRVQFCKDKGLVYQENYVPPSAEEEQKTEPETKEKSVTEGSLAPSPLRPKIKLEEDIFKKIAHPEGQDYIEPIISNIEGFIDDTETTLGDKNTLTKWGIVRILQATGIIKKINPDKSLVDAKDSDLIIINSPKPIIGGSYSESIYIITVNPKYLAPGHTQTNYVLKKNKWAYLKKNSVMKKEAFGKIRSFNTPIKELTDLKKVQLYIVPKLKDAQYAKIAAIGNSASYWDTKQTENKQGEKQYFVVFDAADGKDLDELFDDHLSNLSHDPTKSLEEWRKTMFNVGRALGELHFLLSNQTKNELSDKKLNLENIETIPHGDLHVGNIFYNKKNGNVTFIDVGSMADSLKSPGSPMDDLRRFFAISKYQHNLYEGFHDRNKLLNDDFMAFANGYSQGFSKDKETQENIKNQIIKYFMKISNDVIEYLLSDGKDKQVDLSISRYAEEALMNKTKKDSLKEGIDDNFVNILNRKKIIQSLKKMQG